MCLIAVGGMCYDRRSASRPLLDTVVERARPDAAELDELTYEEKEELRRRRKAAELEGVVPAEIGGSERFELKARRKYGNDISKLAEMG